MSVTWRNNAKPLSMPESTNRNSCFCFDCVFSFMSVFIFLCLSSVSFGMPFIQLFRFHFHCRHSRNVHLQFVFLLPHHVKQLFALDCTRHNFHISSSSYFSSFAFRSTCRNGFYFRTALGDGKQIDDIIGAHNDIQTWSTEHMQAFIIDKLHNEIIQFRSPSQRNVYSLCMDRHNTVAQPYSSILCECYLSSQT